MLGWAARLVTEREWFIQKAIGWWLRPRSASNKEVVRNTREAASSEAERLFREGMDICSGRTGPIDLPGGLKR